MSEEVERTLEKFFEGVRGVTCFRERLKIHAPTLSVFSDCFAILRASPIF